MDLLTDSQTEDEVLDSAEYCAQCETPGVTTVLHRHSFKDGLGEDAVTLCVTVPVRCCGVCDFMHTDDEADQISHNAVCDHRGVLKPTEIRAIREHHGLSRAEFAQITGLEEATLDEWENGARIQTKVEDYFLRLLEAPENLQGLLDRASRERGCDRSGDIQRR